MTDMTKAILYTNPDGSVVNIQRANRVTIGQKVTLGEGCILEEGCTIAGEVTLHECHIGKGSLVSGNQMTLARSHLGDHASLISYAHGNHVCDFSLSDFTSVNIDSLGKIRDINPGKSNLPTSRPQPPASYVQGGGDKGTTPTLVGDRISKTDPRIEAVGWVDQLDASLGLLKSLAGDPRLYDQLHLIQQALKPFMGNLQIPTAYRTGDMGETMRDALDFDRQIQVYLDQMPLQSAVEWPSSPTFLNALALTQSVCQRAIQAVHPLIELSDKPQVTWPLTNQILVVIQNQMGRTTSSPNTLFVDPILTLQHLDQTLEFIEQISAIDYPATMTPQVLRQDLKSIALVVNGKADSHSLSDAFQRHDRFCAQQARLLDGFVTPGENTASALMHWCRATTRTLERDFLRQHPNDYVETRALLNRFSLSFFYIAEGMRCHASSYIEVESFTRFLHNAQRWVQPTTIHGKTMSFNSPNPLIALEKEH